jgi:hypothetical protein
MLTLSDFFITVVNMYKDAILENLNETIENMEPIEGFNDCIAEKTCYRIGEYWTLTYDFDLFKKQLGQNYSDDQQVLDYIFKNCNYDKNSFIKYIKDATPEKALVGVRFGFGDNKNIAVFDYDLCVLSLMEEDEMEEMDAIEYLDFNTVDAYVGEYTPCFLMYT